MNMKKIAMMMAAMTIVVAGFSQHGNMHRRGHRGHAAQEALGLDSAQHAAIKSINKKYHNQARKVKDDSTRTFDARKTELKSIRESREQEISKILTPEQRKKRDAMKEQRGENRKREVQARRERRDERIKSNLSIDDKQLQQMKKARKESFSAAQKEYEKKLKTILSKEQYDSWKEMQDKRKEHHTK
jgi:Spy/CpxP family protein refolding chaperone